MGPLDTKVDDIGGAGFRYSQPVQSKQAGKGVVAGRGGRQQPNADPGAPGVEVAEVGQVGGARTVAVAEEEPSSQPLVGLGIEEQSPPSVRLQCAANRVG